MPNHDAGLQCPGQNGQSKSSDLMHPSKIQIRGLKEHAPAE